MFIAHSVHIGAPPEKIWDAMAGVERWPQFAPQFKSIVRADGGPLALGAKARVTPHGFPGAVWTVTELAAGRSFTWEADAIPGVHLVAGHAIEPEVSGARVTFSLRSSGPGAVLLLPVLAVIARRNTRQAAEGMKAYCEGGAP
jgi:carbon monoxide dehydrogenase subunit G